MAIKVSNQITITEQKRIDEIIEWYLATNKGSGVTIDTEEWTKEIQTITADKPYLWNYEEIVYTLGPSYVSDPIIIGTYGGAGASLQVKYINSENVPSTDNIDDWKDTVPAPEPGKKTYMTQKLSTDTDWSTPIQISATDGKDGSANVEINSDGYWVINGDPTEVKARGEDGESPEITIGEDGYWYINGSPTGTKAEGEAGKDGADIEYVYYRNNDGSTPSTPSYDSNNKLPTGWFSSPKGIDKDHMYEFVSVRTKGAGKADEVTWSAFSTPVIWSKWGEKGQDGDGIAYEYYRSNESDVTKIPKWSADNAAWTDEPQGVTQTEQYEYVVQIKTSNGTSTVSEPTLWAKYGADGKNGRSIIEIINYYQVTSDTIVPEIWQTTMDGLELSPENKYLWNYEEIRYTDGDPTITEPAIIGAYADAGTSVVDFQIYSVDGFEFDNYLTSIELKTVALCNGKRIDPDLSYQWYYCAPGDTVFNQSSVTSKNYIVKMTQEESGCQVYCVITDKNGNSVQTNTVILKMPSPILITKQPTDCTVADGETVKVSVEAQGDGLKYEWYYCNGNETTFNKFIYTNTTPSFSYNMHFGLSGRKVYCVITDEYGNSVTTNTVVTTMENAAKIIEQPTNDVVNNGDYAKTSISATGNDLSYKWYVCNPGETSFQESSVTSATYSVKMTKENDGQQVYCVVTDSFGSAVRSDIAILCTKDSLTILIQPKDVIIEEGEAAYVTAIMSCDGSYQWKWWNALSDNTDKYEDIPGATVSSLVVNNKDKYALAGLKCEMIYNGVTYEDYVSLTEKTTIYTSMVKFFDGSNIFTSNDLYIIAYIELYQNNTKIDSPIDFTGSYYTGISSLSEDGVITSDLEGEFSDGDMMYFVCESDNMYNVVLGEYTSGIWNIVDRPCNYTYKNSLYPDMNSNIVAISKESINKSQSIDFIVYNNDEEISRTNVNVIDSNDPIIGSAKPATPTHNQLWLDTSVTPNVLRIYDQETGEWIVCSDYAGSKIYTSKPESYSKGDLWILAEGEQCDVFGPGSMVKAITSSDVFDESHWIDADTKMTELQENIDQYFEFNTKTGLRIGQKDEKFHVDVGATEIGFYEEDTKVVSIGNKSAQIDNLTVEDGFTVDCGSTFNGDMTISKTINEQRYAFAWKIEDSNGSLSLAIIY